MQKSKQNIYFNFENVSVPDCIPKSHLRGREEDLDRRLVEPRRDGRRGQVRRTSSDRGQSGQRRLRPTSDATLQSTKEASP